MNDKLREIQDKRNRFISAPKSFVCVSDYVDDTGYLLSEIDRLNGELEKANDKIAGLNERHMGFMRSISTPQGKDGE